MSIEPTWQHVSLEEGNTCLWEDCFAPAQWFIEGFFYCNKHAAKLSKILEEEGFIMPKRLKKLMRKYGFSENTRLGLSEKIDNALGLIEDEGQTTKGATQISKNPSFSGYHGSTDAKGQNKISPGHKKPKKTHQ